MTLFIDGARDAVAMPTPTPARPPGLRRIFAALMVGLLVSELDATVFSTALPTIAGDLDGVHSMLWVTTAYVLAAAVAMPVYGRLGDSLGRQRLFVAALAVFVAGSVIGGLSPSMGWLIAGRAVQGLGGGGLLVLAQAIVADLVPARRRAPYLTVIGAVFALAAAGGPLLGGWFADGIGWRWAFWINIPLGLAALVLAAQLLPPPLAARRRVRFDAAGAATLAVAVTGIVLVTAWGGTQLPWSSPVVVVLALGTVAALGALLVIERDAEAPIVPLWLFRTRNVVTATGASFVLAIAVFGTVTYLPTYLQMVRGLSATGSGLMMVALIAGLGSSTVGAAQLVSRTGHYKWLTVTGAVGVVVALVLLASLGTDASNAHIRAVLFLFGAGVGCVLEVLVVVVQDSVDPAYVGTATALHNACREIGVSVGTAVIGTLFTVRLAASLSQGSSGPGAAAGLTPEHLHRLSEAARRPIVAAYQDAFVSTLHVCIPVMMLSVLALTLIRPHPLSDELSDELPADWPVRGAAA